MTDLPTILQVVHGYPPKEVAGTELYTARLTAALRRRGWRVEVLAATRDAGQRHGSLAAPIEPGAPWRLVNNLPWRPLAARERDPGTEARVAEVLAAVQPDLVHVQHLMFLSVGVRWGTPVLATLHDAWAWCARGGNLLRGGASPCPGPEPQACADCYADQARGSAVEHTLGRVAGRLGRWVSAARLHQAWRALPAEVQGLTRRGPPQPTSAQDAADRQDAVLAAFQGFDLRVAPSAWLAAEAEAQGLGTTVHVPHGVAPGPSPEPGGDCVFLGSLVPHKGAHVVVEGWQHLRRERAIPPLVLHGPLTDAAYVLTLPQEQVSGPLAPDRVPGMLARARVLILGSVWPENAPLVVLEARASGCPVVAPRIGGLPELIEPGVDGALYTPGDPGSLAAALARVLDTTPTPRPPPTFDDHMDEMTSHYRSLLS